MKKAFTLAEVLITLGIIGVVAAITIPGLITNYKVHALHSQFFKSYSTLQQAFKQMEADDVSLNPLDYEEKTFYKTFANYLNVAVDCGSVSRDMKNAAGCFYYKSTNTTTEGDSSYKTYDGKKEFRKALLDDGQLLLNDGTNILFENLTTGTIYVTVDINGINSLPNRAGYDLFTFQFLDGELLTMGSKGTKYDNLNNYCNYSVSNELNGIACAHKAKTQQDYFKQIVKEFK